MKVILIVKKAEDKGAEHVVTALALAVGKPLRPVALDQLTAELAAMGSDDTATMVVFVHTQAELGLVRGALEIKAGGPTGVVFLDHKAQRRSNQGDGAAKVLVDVLAFNVIGASGIMSAANGWTEIDNSLGRVTKG